MPKLIYNVFKALNELALPVATSCVSNNFLLKKNDVYFATHQAQTYSLY